jgi:very-short-patch-repair endonuclease
MDKLLRATEINDLYDESPLEDLLWDELKQLGIRAERQEFLALGNQQYSLDFAVYCAAGKLVIQTDGDTWHANPERAAIDNVRANDLESAGWNLLRFSTKQINEQMSEYCLPKIVETVNGLGGVDEGGVVPRRIHLSSTESTYQPSLFDTIQTAGDNEDLGASS